VSTDQLLVLQKWLPLKTEATIVASMGSHVVRPKELTHSMPVAQSRTALMAIMTERTGG